MIGHAFILMTSSPGSTVLSTTKPPVIEVTVLTTGSCDRVDRLTNLRSSGGLGLDGWDMTNVFSALRMPRIVSGLHPRPDSRPVSKKLAETDRDGRRHRLPFLQDIVKMLARNREKSGNLRLGPAGGWNNIIAKQGAGMSRAAIVFTLCRVDHVCSFNGTVRNRRATPHRLRTRTRYTRVR